MGTKIRYKWFHHLSLQQNGFAFPFLVFSLRRHSREDGNPSPIRHNEQRAVISIPPEYIYRHSHTYNLWGENGINGGLVVNLFGVIM